MPFIQLSLLSLLLCSNIAIALRCHCNVTVHLDAAMPHLVRDRLELEIKADLQRDMDCDFKTVTCVVVQNQANKEEWIPVCVSSLIEHFGSVQFCGMIPKIGAIDGVEIGRTKKCYKDMCNALKKTL